MGLLFCDHKLLSFQNGPFGFWTFLENGNKWKQMETQKKCPFFGLKNGLLVYVTNPWMCLKVLTALLLFTPFYSFYSFYSFSNPHGNHGVNQSNNPFCEILTFFQIEKFIFRNGHFFCPFLVLLFSIWKKVEKVHPLHNALISKKWVYFFVTINF